MNTLKKSLLMKFEEACLQFALTIKRMEKKGQIEKTKVGELNKKINEIWQRVQQKKKEWQ